MELVNADEPIENPEDSRPSTPQSEISQAPMEDIIGKPDVPDKGGDIDEKKKGRKTGFKKMFMLKGIKGKKKTVEADEELGEVRSDQLEDLEQVDSHIKVKKRSSLNKVLSRVSISMWNSFNRTFSPSHEPNLEPHMSPKSRTLGRYFGRPRRSESVFTGSTDFETERKTNSLGRRISSTFTKSFKMSPKAAA